MNINPQFSYIKLEKLGKRPAQSWRGRSRATLDEVQSWVDEGFGLGILTSRASSVWVLDIDIDTETMKPSREWQELEFMHGLPETFTVRTPSNGLHLYFRHPEDFTVKNDQGIAVCKGVDIRGDGGYVVAPGTVVDYEKHGVNFSGSYSISKDVTIARTPEWLAALLRHREEVKTRPETRREVSESHPVAKAKVVDGDRDRIARSELNDLIALASKLTKLPQGHRMELFGEQRGWEEGNGFFLLACRIIEIARWPHTTVTVDQAHEVWRRTVPGRYRTHTWNYALDAASATWEYGDRLIEGEELDAIFGF